MNDVMYDKDFCKEKCEIYRKMIMRLEGYNIPRLVEQQEQKLSSFCKESCTHTREEFNEWMKARKLPSLVKKLFGIV